MGDRSQATFRSPQQPQSCRSDGELNADGEEDEGDAEMEKLQEEVCEMAQKLTSYRSTLPAQFTSGVSALFAASRPQSPVLHCSTGLDRDPGSHGGFSEGVIAITADQETTDRMKLLKEKISSNISAMPLILQRMKECISRIDKHGSCSDIIHPAFK